VDRRDRQRGGCLGAKPGQVVVAVDQQANDDGVIVCSSSPEPSVAEPGDRGCEGVVGVVLRRLGRTEQPHPGREGRWDVDHVFAGGEELLG
jgi:hypothetical protein